MRFKWYARYKFTVEPSLQHNRQILYMNLKYTAQNVFYTNAELTFGKNQNKKSNH